VTSLVGLALACLVGLWFLAKVVYRRRVRQALRLTFSHTALLVPAAMTSAACAVLLRVSATPTLHENPFGLAAARHLGIGQPVHWILLVVVALALAGQIGVLQAWRQGRPADGIAFLAGIKQHALTIVLGKVLLFAAIYGVSSLRPGSVGRALYIVPNLLLAPLAGVAALHPHRPLRAIAAALRTTVHQFQGVGNLVFSHVVVVVALFYAACRITRQSFTFDHLAYGASTLSYNFFPHALIFSGPLGWTVVAANALAASVFVTSHFLCAEQGYDDDGEERAEAERAAQPPDGASAAPVPQSE
jgi:hypothetical protein